jgi:hypothetical protein
MKKTGMTLCKSMQNNTDKGERGYINTKSASTQHSNQNEIKYVERKQPTMR